MRKAMTNEQVGNIGSRYNALSKSWGMSSDEAGGAWIGAAFENQNQHLEFKGMDWQTGQLKDGGSAFVDEAFEKKGTYQLSQMSAHTISQLSDIYGKDQLVVDELGGQARETLTAEQKSQLDSAIDRQGKIKQISE